MNLSSLTTDQIETGEHYFAPWATTEGARLRGCATTPGPVQIAPGAQLRQSLRLTAAVCLLLQAKAQATGDEQLSSQQVSAMPLNKHGFSQLLLLAAGTQTGTNGADNFTQQFMVNGQRGSASGFSMDGIDTTDADMGGATFSNLNGDAIEEISSRSGVMSGRLPRPWGGSSTRLAAKVRLKRGAACTCSSSRNACLLFSSRPPRSTRHFRLSQVHAKRPDRPPHPT